MLRPLLLLLLLVAAAAAAAGARGDAAAYAAAAGLRGAGGAEQLRDDEDADRSLLQQQHHDEGVGRAGEEHGARHHGGGAAEHGGERRRAQHDHPHSDHHHHRHHLDDDGGAVGDAGGAAGTPIELIRVGSMLCIAAIKVSFAFAPLRFRTNPALLSSANAFAAGVFLAGGFAHLLPEAVEAFSAMGAQEGDGGHDAHEHGHEHGHGGCGGASRPYVLSVCGFLLTFYLEKVFLRAQAGAAKDSPAHGHAAGDAEAPPRHATAGGAPHGHDHSHGLLAALAVWGPEQQQGPAPLAPLVLTLVLSTHSVVSGMALGVQQDPGRALLILLAIVAHKWVEAFSLGVSIVRAALPMPLMSRLIAAFALSSPLGVALGWVLQRSTQGPTAALVTATLDAAASGTFIYIAIVDTLHEEFAHGHCAQRKFAAVCAGFATMLWLGTLVAHHH